MNDQLKSALRSAALIGLTHLATRYHLSGDQITAIVTDAGVVGAAVYGVYDHWGMKKVPSTAEVKV